MHAFQVSSLLANFRQIREEQDQEYAESLHIDEAKVFVYNMHYNDYVMFIYCA